MARGTPETLAAYLAAHHVDAQLLYPGRSTATVPEAAAALGVPPGQIIKSLVFTNSNGTLVLAVVPGDRRVDPAKLAALVGGERLRLASPAIVEQATGYPPGATPPVGHLTPLPVVVDASLLAHAVVYGGGGASDTMLAIAPADIVRLTNARVEEITESPHAEGSA